ncbi:hypothetical protein FDECE_2934 [Fusarium decemcellulare]|nr:hypothetical protein FDECE_2934 [Fusarium decemcellulare]
MDKSKTRPLRTIHLKSRPLTTHALAWSCDAELAVATDDTIYILLPEYPRGGGPDDAGEDEELQSQFSLAYRASGLIRPDPTINAQLCAFSGIRVVGPPANDENWFPGVGNGVVTGSGASISQIVRLEWSPNGLGCNLRPILTALSTNGAIYALGEHIDRQSTLIAGMSTRSFKAWKTLWGLGAQLPLPDTGVEDGYRNMNERIQSFSWAKEMTPGQALLAYSNDMEEIAIMSVQLFGRPRDEEPLSEEMIWDLREIARFDGRGRHTKEDALDITDPDYVPHGSAFSLKWSPWLSFEGKRVAILAYIAKNHVGFRRVTVLNDWGRGKVPEIEVEQTDMTSISNPKEIVLEDEKPVARGVISTPFDVKPFQVSFLDAAKEPSEPHYTWECSTTYSKDDEVTSTNPISGLMIHDRDHSSTGPVPYYSVVRLSATANNQDWFQTNLSDAEASLPEWAARMRRHTTRLVSRAMALEGLDSDSEVSEDDFMEEDSSQLQVPESRYRIWGIAASPGGCATAVLVSRYSTQHPERRALCKLMFARSDGGNDGEGNQNAPATSIRALTTEGQVWEWMYGSGPEVPGTTVSSKISPELQYSPLREQFRSVAARQHCVFCDSELRMEGDEARCHNGHSFGISMRVDWIGYYGARHLAGLRRVRATVSQGDGADSNGRGAPRAGNTGRGIGLVFALAFAVAQRSLTSSSLFVPPGGLFQAVPPLGNLAIKRSAALTYTMPATRADTALAAENANFEESLASKPFLFIVGEERKEFHIHKELIGQLSPVLNALVNGRMKEAHEGRIEWPDLDVDTFVRFAKFAYSGDYSPAEPELVVPEIPVQDVDLTRSSANHDELERQPRTAEHEGNDDDGDSMSSDPVESSELSSGSSDLDGSGDGDSSLEDSLDDDQDISSSEDALDQDLLHPASQLYSTSSSGASSTLDNGRSYSRQQANESRHQNHITIHDEYGVAFLPPDLPYSVHSYMSDWEAYVDRVSYDYHSEIDSNPRKRHRTDHAGAADVFVIPVKNKKYEAMREFSEPTHKWPVYPGAPSSDVIRGNPDPFESFEPVLLGHARLYILADKYGVETLRKLSLYRLQHTLVYFTIHWERVPDLIALSQEVFNNTMENDEARRVIVNYFACVIEHIRECPELIDALRAGGDFAAALVDKMAMRM